MDFTYDLKYLQKLKSNIFMKKNILQNNLEKKMKEKGFNMKSLSLKAGLNETAVRDIIKGRVVSPTINNLNKICVVLNCSIDDLYKNTEDEQTYKDYLENIDLNIFAKSVEKIDDLISEYNINIDSRTKAKIYLACYNLLIIKGDSDNVNDLIKKVI